MTMEEKQLEPLRPRKVYDKRPSAYQEMARLNRRWPKLWAREEAEYYQGEHKGEYLHGQALEEAAAQQALIFKHNCEEQDGIELNEEALTRFRKAWIEDYKQMEWCEAHPEECE